MTLLVNCMVMTSNEREWIWITLWQIMSNALELVKVILLNECEPLNFNDEAQIFQVVFSSKLPFVSPRSFNFMLHITPWLWYEFNKSLFQEQTCSVEFLCFWTKACLNIFKWMNEPRLFLNPHFKSIIEEALDFDLNISEMKSPKAYYITSKRIDPTKSFTS